MAQLTAYVIIKPDSGACTYRIPEHALTGSRITEAADAGDNTLVTACELLSAFAIAKPTTEVSGILKVDGAGSGSGRLG